MKRSRISLSTDTLGSAQISSSFTRMDHVCAEQLFEINIRIEPFVVGVVPVDGEAVRTCGASATSVLPCRFL